MNELSAFHHDIKTILEQARGKARSAVNAAMVEAYWLIGRRIVQKEQQGQHKAQYGERLLENLAIELSTSFGKGFSYANLRNFRQFYLTYPDQAICYTVCSKLSWSHNRLIMCVDDAKARDYYLREGYEQQWSVLQLERNIKTQSFQRLLASQEGLPTKGNNNDNSALLVGGRTSFQLPFFCCNRPHIGSANAHRK